MKPDEGLGIVRDLPGVTFAEPPPPLGQLLDRIELFTRRYVVLDEAQATASTLWVPHTWAIAKAGEPRYVVRYRRGGRESRPRYGGSFRLRTRRPHPPRVGSR